MRLSRAFWRSLREPPADAELASHRLLVRAGYVHQLGSGIFSLLPLGKRASRRVEDVMREEIEAIGGQELELPVVNPADVWKETGRYHQVGSEMTRFADRGGRDMVLAMTHEEVVAFAGRDLIQSYRQLPQVVYHVQTKWRDDPRPRGGLIRVREFVMKDSYSLDADREGMERSYRAHHEAYERIFERCGLPVVSVLADVGMMGGSASHEFMYLTPAGEDRLAICEACGHRANQQVATYRKEAPAAEEPAELEEVATPGAATIADLADFLEIPRSRTAKAVFLVATRAEGEEEVEELVLALVRGDTELAEAKLRNATGARELRPATDEEIRAHGAVPGYASPMGLEDARVVADDLIADSPNLVAGANREGHHLRNVNHGRDFEADVVADLAVAEAGFPCPECGEPLVVRRGVEVGNIFQLGTRYSEPLGCTFTDADGRERPVWMGSYGIGSGRLLACVAEEHHDEHGLAWPASIAPFPAHLLSLGEEGAAAAEEVYGELVEAGLEPLYDDRDESAGVKFNDADLLGMPVRLVVSGRSLADGGVELKRRREDATRVVARSDLVGELRSILEEEGAGTDGA